MAADSLPAGSAGALRALLEWLDQHHPELRAAAAEQEAAEARVQPAGALPDPMFSVEWREISTTSPNLDPTQVGAMRYQFRQTLPGFGKRDKRAEIAESGVLAAKARYRVLQLSLQARAKRGYAEWVAARQSQRVLRGLQGVLTDAEAVTKTRYAAGLASQRDVLRAQSEIATLQNELAVAEGAEAKARARLNALLQRPAPTPLAEGDFVPLPAVLDWLRLTQQLSVNNPQLHNAEAKIVASQGRAELSRLNRWPDLTVGVAPMQKGSRFDTWELMLEINLPLQRETRRNQERETAALEHAERTRLESLRTQLEGELGEWRAEYEAATHHIEVLQHSSVPQLELAYQAAQAAYASGGGKFAELIDAQKALKKVQIELINAQRNARLALAEIELRVGESL